MSQDPYPVSFTREQLQGAVFELRKEVETLTERAEKAEEAAKAWREQYILAIKNTATLMELSVI